MPMFRAAGDFAAAHDVHAQLAACGLGLFQPGHGVVVGQGNGRQTSGLGRSHQGSGRIRAVRSRGMRMQIHKFLL